MNRENVRPIHIEQEIKSSFLDYSMSVIVSRALPDVRDGLKPVHRRILYAMYDLKNFHNKSYLKSSRIVGDVLGKYHPHGDSSVYDALVRMAQNFSMRYPLVDGQGNFGSIDGDHPAAMRYTESRMEHFSEYLLSDLDKETVNFVPNYDNKDQEPSVLPSMLPQLLVNGSSGIAVGMATNIPPHNLSEVILGLKELILNPEITLTELMQYIKGPDFPTKAEIHGTQGIFDAYQTGRGSIVMRAKAHVEEVTASHGRERIVITEIPYQVNKAKLVEKIADLVLHKKIEGISDIRDESAKEEIRVVIELKKGESSEVILNNLYKLTPMQSFFGINLVALVKGLPKLLTLKGILIEFYEHRRDVVIRRTAYLLKKAQERAHILEGLKIAVENIDHIVSLIKSTQTSEEAFLLLKKNYTLTDLQARSILDMRLGRLTALETDKIISECLSLEKEIGELKLILSNSERIKQIILSELDEMISKFGDERRTLILSNGADELTMESLIADEEVAVTVTFGGYVKRTTLSSIVAQKRGGKGKSGLLTKGEDVVQSVFITSNHQSLLCFTNSGKVYLLKVYQIPDAVLRSQGRHFANLIKLDPEERVVSVLPVKVFKENLYILSITAAGVIKKTDLMAYSQVRSNGIIALKLEQDDSLISCALAADDDQVILATKQGKAVRFCVSDIRSVGRVAVGVIGIRFAKDEDRVVGMEILKPETKNSYILSVCEKGYGKRTEIEEYRVQGRGGQGTITIKVNDRNGPVVGISQVSDSDDLMIITSSGKLVRFSIKDVSVVGRIAQGVKLVSVGPEEKVIGISRVEQDSLIEEE
jgi:DNA gyrase subunit A